METQSVNGDINYYKQCFTLDPSQMAGVPCSTHARSMFLEVALGGGVLGVRRTLASDFSSVNPGTVSHFCNLDLAVRQNLLSNSLMVFVFKNKKTVTAERKNYTNYSNIF